MSAIRLGSARTQGFTLVEASVALLITGMVTISLYQVLKAGQQSADRNRTLVALQQDARVGMQSLGDDIREVSYGKDPTQPSINYAGPDSVTFVGDIMPEYHGAERISYFLSRDGDPDTPNPDDTVLMKVVTDTAGQVLVSAPQAYGVSRGGLHFRWYNGGGVELPNPVPQPEQVGEIFVSLTSTAAEMLGGTYPTYTLSTTIYPRNLPLSPARSRPSSPGCQALTFPDCESATATWTTPTTNTDGTELLLADISNFCIYYGTNTDSLSLYTKLARTINQWTIGGLNGGQTYYIAVSCVSRSGVESYMCTRSADMNSAFVPLAPATLTCNGWHGAGVVLNWPAVTQFTGGGTITTPVTYAIYRGDAPGFTPDAGNRLATVTTTTLTDSTMTQCSTMYYLVTAKACGNESASSNEVSGSVPAPPSCPTGIAGSAGPGIGEVTLTWSAPTTRMDGTSLSGGAIAGYHVFADTFPSNQTLVQDFVGDVTTGQVSGLAACKTYYMNLQCLDTCGHTGDICPGNELTVFTSAPCDPAAPDRPATYTLTAGDQLANLQWPANTTNCDLFGYKIYYGTQAGGPYNGTGAAQGNSPIALTKEQVTHGSICTYQLTNLSACQNYYSVVTSTDLCTPPNESTWSTESGGTTTCLPCQIAGTCAPWAVDGVSSQQLHSEIYTTSASAETMTRLTATYAGAQKITQVWFGKPLVKIWASDGTAGGDGNVGPRPSGTALDVNDVSIPTTTTQSIGMPLELVFDTNIRDVAMQYDFRGLSGTCSATGTGRLASRVDDFDDGNYSGWTAVSGTWSVAGMTLGESLTSSYYLLTANTLSLADLTIDAKVLANGGSQHGAYIVFRYVSSSDYRVVGIRADTDRVRYGRIKNGAWFSEPAGANATINDNQWYDLRVSVTGTRVRAWLNCQQVIDYTDATLAATGSVGLSAQKAAAKFDDVKIFAATVLP